MTENTLGSGCSGYGGLELGISQVIPNITTRWVADYEPPTPKKPNPKQTAATILRHRFPGVPNLGDITIVDWSTTAHVKIICAGTPCQDVSAAGARAGMRAGTRSGIWSSMVEAIAHHRPTLVVWENVRGALSATADSNVEPCPICLGDNRECTLRALGRVLGDLSELGFDAVWEVVAASDIGAPHRRERVIVAAWPADPDRDTVRVEPVTVTGGSGATVAGQPAEDTHSAARSERGVTAPGQAPRGRARADTGRPDRTATAADPGHRDDPERSRPQGWESGQRPAVGKEPRRDRDLDWGPFAAAITRWEHALGRPAPRPTDLSPRGGQTLSARFVEWMMGLPAGWVTDVPGLTRNEQLHALGNGVVPQQAAHALRRLLPHAPEWVKADLGLSTPSPTPRG